MAIESDRPRPEALLEQAAAEERRKQRGKLRIFLGFAAGVGKTYAMLEAAREQLAQGRDVVVAYAETHGRQETEGLLTALRLIARRRVEYRGVALEEMDLDAVLHRRPQLALVDELAHTNAPGSRHTKRCQDVDELLAAGIDVYTTLNIQHVESLNDVVAQITGITVHETVPDRILEEADEIDVVDLPPDELTQRLHEGKVYLPEQASRAVEKFFRPGNLNALREIALRYVAGRVDRQMRTYMGAHAIPGPWPAGERVLVCLDPSPVGERLVRTGRRLATGLDAEWTVLHVETAEDRRYTDEERDRLARLLRLAEDLGATLVRLPGTGVAEEVIRYARAQNITKIIVGASRRPWWFELVRGAVVDRIIRTSGATDVYVIRGPAERLRHFRAERKAEAHPRTPYLYSAAIIGLVTATSSLVRDRLDPANLTMPYLLAVVIIALEWGRGPAILGAALGVVMFDFFFVPPHFSFAVSDTQYLLTFLGLLVVGVVISSLAGRAREQAQASRQREAYTAALYALSGDLAATSGLEAIAAAVARHIAATFSREVAVFVPVGGRLQPVYRAPGFPLDDNELAVAAWVFEHGEAAGHGTDTLPAASARYLPLKTAQAVRGVLAVRPATTAEPLTPEQRNLAMAFANQAALAIERMQLVDVARRVEVLRETEKLQAALLDSVSHELRTPLASITGSLSSLADPGTILDDVQRRELLETAREQAEHMNRLVGNLLEMTRLEAGALKLRLAPTDAEELIGTVVSKFGETLRGREVTIDVAPDLPPVRMDFVLVTQALANVLDNAIKYSPPGTPIEIHAAPVGSVLHIRIADRGAGIPSGEAERIFDKFYRIRRPRDAGGVGLGLSISAGVAELHGGRIWAENREGGGTSVTFAVPMGIAVPSTG
ncbi:MAG TPA: sensor histidine kinase KdpD [bacterium]|nr:sensor histidine kinase KdpD [bacterium]